MFKVLFVLLSTAMACANTLTYGAPLANADTRVQLLLAPPQEETFDVWASKNGKFYAPTERDYRQTIYEQNMAKHYSWTMANNNFADLTEKEVAIKQTSTHKRTYQALRGSVAAS